MDRYQNDLQYLYGLTRRGIKLGLENTRRLLQLCGNPQVHGNTVHIAGTNGKGSTAAFAESILRNLGNKVGLYTSPHLHDFCERIQVNRHPLPRETFFSLVDEVRSLAEQANLPVTFFEFTTVMAFLHFQRCHTGWNVLEVGLGGRLDATNLCHSKVSVITSIDWDHMDYLGNSLESIAGEKAGIIREGGTVVAGKLPPGPLKIVEETAKEHNARLLLSGRDFEARRIQAQPSGHSFRFVHPKITLDELQIPLPGSHQVENAGLAIAACIEALSSGQERPSSASLADAISRGLAGTIWPGRMELVAGDPAIVLDCAHNPHGIKQLINSLGEHFEFRRCICVVGIMNDKAWLEMIELLSTISDRLILTRPDSERSWSPGDHQKECAHIQKPIEIIEEIQYAVHIAQNLSHPGDLILVTGSLLTVAEARQLLVNQGIITNNPALEHTPSGSRAECGGPRHDLAFQKLREKPGTI